MDERTGLPVVGMVGAGQLARMTHQAAIALGQSLRVLAAHPDDGAALVAADVRAGHHGDLEALRTFAEGCDVVTLDHEHVPPEHLRALEDAGVSVLPGSAALLHAQDKQVMRERLTALGCAVPRWAPVRATRDGATRDSATRDGATRDGATRDGAAGEGAAADRAVRDQAVGDLERFAAEAGWPVVLKAVRGGYDGRGVWVAPDVASAEALVGRLAGTPLLVEELVPLRRELAAVVARSAYGQVAAWPVVETVQRDGICVEVLAPAPGLDADRAVEAQGLAIRLADALGVVGVLAVELFERPDGVLLVNELAMRPHNSGHWTIEGSRTSQFEQHLRAVLDYPLGATGLTAPAVCMANVLGGEPGGMPLDERLHHLFAAEPEVKVHLYGKAGRPGRKIGHVTALGDDLADVRARAGRAARWLRDGVGDLAGRTA